MKSFIKYLFVFSLLICLFYSCSNEEEIPVLSEQEVPNHIPCTITIDLNKGVDSRLALYDTGKGAKSKWEEGDGFTLFKYYRENEDNDNSNDIAVVKYNFTLQSGAGTSVGVFYCESTPPAEDYNYRIYYPSEEAYNTCSFLEQEQDGDGNMDHLKDKILMRHLIGHYTDVRFTSSDYNTSVQTDSYSYSIGTIGGNLRKNIILKIKGSNLPEDFEPTELSVEVSNTEWIVFWITNNSYYTNNESLKAKISLKNFDQDKDFEVYMACAVRDITITAGASIRISVKDADGNTYYVDKPIANDLFVERGNMLTLNCNSGWVRGNNVNYKSSDFSADGRVHALTPIKEGNINVVLMGDGFSDRQIADGTYEEVMQQGMDAFLSEEPFISYADKFNIYYVDVVSGYEGCIEPNNTGRTAFETYFGSGTHVGGNNSKVLQYTLKVDALTEDKIDNYTAIVMMNSTKYAGTCWMSSPRQKYDFYGQGWSVSYFPIGASYEALRQVLTHEANGHGFGKLGDEYDGKAITSDAINEYKTWLNNYGFYSNVDITSDVTKTLWSEFYEEPYITREGIGAYEGAYTYYTGFYRPTLNSIMRYNVGGFNAPSRQTIYTRINKLIDPLWEYDHEEFKNWDYHNIPASPVSVSSNVAPKASNDDLVPLEFVPLAPPVVVNK